MERLIDKFNKTFSIPFDTLPLPAQPILPIGEDEYLVGSKEAMERPLLTQGEILKFDTMSLPNYFLIGFWGHGANSYAFYYSRNDGENKICFRLPYGGVYMDNEKAATDISQFLRSFFAFEHELKNKGINLIAIDSMGEGRYQTFNLDKIQNQYSGSLFGRCDVANFLGYQ